MGRICTKCGERYSGREVSQLKSWGEKMWLDPFICPDCYDALRRKSLEDQEKDLLNEKPAEHVG